MRTLTLATAAIVLTVATSAAHAATLPQAVADLMTAVADDPDSLAVVVKAAKKANPDAVAEIDAHASGLAAQVAAKKAEQSVGQGFLRGWTGEVEFGGAINTGNTDDHSLTTALALDWRTPKWEQDLDVRTSFKSEDGETTTDRYFATYVVTRNLSPRLYMGGILWAERDRFAGHNYRFSESVGVGYRLIKQTGLNLAVEGGPALRQSEYLERGYEATVAARLAGYLTWRALPRLEFSQSIVTYLDSKNSTLLATSALTTKLQGNLSARASYEVRHEENPPSGRETTDTTTRATLAVSF